MEKDRSNETHILTIRRGMGYRYKISALFIEGKYLEKWGFPIGTKIAIQCSKGELVIKPADIEDYIKRNNGEPLTYITRLFDKDFNQLDFLRWKDYSGTEAVISACKELYANPVFKNKLKETAQFRIELLDGTTVYSSDNSIFIKKRSMKKPVKAVAEESKYTSK